MRRSSCWQSGLLAAVLAVAAGVSGAGEKPAGAKITFSAQPKAVAEGKRVKITFELSAPVDVAVGIVNGKGVVVKHLGGGLLGPKAPKPFKAGGLAQTLYWDRTDDCGKPVPAGKYSVRVRAGMIPRFERIIGYEPLAFSSVLGLAVGAKGELFVMNAGGVWVERWKPSLDITVYSRDMKYLRTVMPYPGDLAYDRIKGINPTKRPDGRWVPKVYHGPNRIPYPGLCGRPQQQVMAATPGGELLLTHQYRSWRLLRLRTADGATPEPFDVNGIVIKDKPKKTAFGSGNTQIAVSADGKWAYIAGLTKPGKGNDEKKGRHAVYRYKLGTDDAAQPFIGDPKAAGNDETHLRWPTGVATDGKGNVLVSDSGNDRIAVFSPAGKFLGAAKVSSPRFLAVDRKRGTIYVLTGEYFEKKGRRMWRFKALAKLKSWKQPKLLGEYKTTRRGRPPTTLALDWEAEQPILYFSDGVSGSRGGSGNGLWRIVDKDPAGALGAPEHVAFAGKYPGMPASVEHVAVDPATERVYVSAFHSAFKRPKWFAFDGKTGKPLSFGKVNAADLRVGYDGYLYGYESLHVRGCYMKRWTSEGKPARFEGGAEKSEQLPDMPDPKGKHWGFRDREGVSGFDVAPNGDMYVQHFWGSTRTKEARGRLSVVGPDGKIKKACLIRALTNTACSARVDRYGNIYVMDDVLPAKSPPAPPGFVKVLETERGYLGIRGLFGSIVKFPPTGGAIYHSDKEKPAPAGSKRVLCRKGHVVEDSVWIRPYASPVYGKGGHWCFCFAGRFGLDRYGRLFIPNAPVRRVEVVDGAGNLMAAFGRYGNVDNGGPGSKRPLKGVPMNWGANVAVSDSAVYIADTNNRCVIKVRLDYKATGICPLP